MPVAAADRGDLSPPAAAAKRVPGTTAGRHSLAAAVPARQPLVLPR
ncbi:hypothetical protein L248_1907 [Schleiferilactobacillus shenzhenensis LY-73]|uniref:Uncharacterized protein n=1 Tax=Schleiferilactobacillus shenzhenensis LY-73 TaxID=1231336 RepID=U4TWW6_9LACO|nr:hypothetical protein L248_1907 [Schleiferilactobacillus shenzhenensis LY-73]